MSARGLLRPMAFRVLATAACALAASWSGAQSTSSQITGNSGPVVHGNQVGGNLTVIYGEEAARRRQPVTGAATTPLDPEAASRDERKALLDAIARDPIFADVLARLTGAAGIVQASNAVKALDEAVTKGSGLAAMLRGLVFQNGWWGTRDEAEARRHFLLAADRGVPGAQVLVQQHLFNGAEGFQRDRRRSSQYLEKLVHNETAVRQLRADAALWLANRWRYGDDNPKDLCTAMRFMAMAAELGQLDGMTELGWMRHRGDCIPADRTLAFEWWRRAADAGHGPAAEAAGEALYFGRGVRRDFIAALRYLESASHPWAISTAAWIYAKGQHHAAGTPDYGRAFALARRAAEAGNWSSMINLGLFYEYGLGVQQSVAEAYYWYDRAASTGYLSAPAYQARLVIDGCISAEKMPNWRQALEALAANADAADQARARTELARAHLFGLAGLTRDEPRAIDLLRSACRADYTAGCAVLRVAKPNAAELSPAVIARLDGQGGAPATLLTEGSACTKRIVRYSADPYVFP